MIRLPPEAPAGVRIRILDALKSDAYSIYQDGRSFLEKNDFVPEQVIKDVIGYLEDGCRLYYLPSCCRAVVKYQCCLDYDDIVVHVKLRPDETPCVWIGFHRHDTGYDPLPA